MPDPKVPRSASRANAAPPERQSAREVRMNRQAQRQSERLVAEWLRRLSTRRT